ncbi:MAG: TIGR02453 family protein [Rhodobacteraceae bacterium]|nr:TIGR02453 family protein [Paracoccaceae bacterium]
MTGFSAETLTFLANLSSNNTREWFQANRSDYERFVKKPSKVFADQLAQELATTLDMPIAYKLFRINRDLRFSKDKTPYNCHIHLSLFEDKTTGTRPAWMLGLEPGKLTFGAGLMALSSPELSKWREAVAGSAGPELANILAGLKSQGCRIPEPELKRIPAPYSDDNQMSDLLKRKSLTVWTETDQVDDVFGTSGPRNCLHRLEPFDGLLKWVRTNL